MGTIRSQRRRSRIFSLAATLLAAACTLTIPTPAGAADLSGHWHAVDGVFSVLEQTGDSVRLTNTHIGRVYEGTRTGSSVELSWSGPYYPESYSLTLSPDESTLTGDFHTVVCVLSFCTAVTANVTISRCGCWDGNTDGGDGCDVQCQVEPCHSCTAEPSTCTPVADATPCEDPSDCVSGGTCSAGTCDGGVQAASCMAIDGRWLGTELAYEDESHWTHLDDVVQQDGALSLFQVPGGYRGAVGTIDPATRALTIAADNSWPYCGISGLDGSVAADGRSYTGTRWAEASTPHGCVGIDVVGEVGLRCASTDLRSSDGCAVDSCQRCTGDPVVCEPIPDQTPCHSDDPCTVVAACQRGECVASVSDVCPVCETCNGSGGCISAPRSNCRKTDDPASTKLSIKSTKAGASGSFRWDWSDGGAIRRYDLGRPEAFSDVALCVFDESGAQAVPLLQANVDYEYSGSSTVEGWKVAEDGSASYRDRAGYFGGVISIDLVAGPAGESRIRVKGKRGGLPAAPISLPLRAQLQIQGGACFEGTYDSDGVGHNAGGSFRAKGTP